MSKILLDKINNILNIDKNKEYINLSLQNPDDFIQLSNCKSYDEIDNFINSSDELIITFNSNYQNILDNVKTFNNFKDLNKYLSTQNINFRYESKIFHEKWQKQNKQINNDNQKIAQFKADEIILIEEEFLHYKKDVYEKIKDELLNGVKKFDILNSKSKKAFIDQGKQLLRLGFDFIQGHVNETYIDAPLFLFDIEIEINENKVKIIKKSNRKLNEKLLIFILNKLEFNYKDLNFNQIKTKEDFEQLIEPIVQYKIKDEDKIENKALTKDKYRTLKYINNFYLGLFDTQAGKIKEDFVELMENNVQLLNDKMKNDFEFYTKEEFKDKALIQINNPLNIYQKYAVRSAINENTLIYGPPGTGKSEIITSIVANLLMKSKSILVVSEKEAALEVIKKRLANLSVFAFYLKDIEDENLFYNQIETISFYMGSFYNDEYKNKKFDLEVAYQNNDRVLDYNKEINRFRNVLQEDIHFSLEKDSRNNDYRDYLLSIQEIEKFVKENKNGVEEFWKEYENKFVKLQSATEFISKVAEFNWFKEKYELNEDETNRFDHLRHEFNRFLADNDLINFKLNDFDDIYKKVNSLDNFIQQQLLHKDKDFIANLEQNYHFLKQNYNLWNKINSILENVKEKEYIKRFLLKYSAKHEKFLNKYLNLSSVFQENLAQRYFYKAEISTSKLIFKTKKNKDTIDAFVKAIQEFEKIKLFKSNIYLNQLIKNDYSIFEPIIIYFWNNKNLLKKSFFEFYNQQIINFDQRIIHQYYKYRVNQIERELINVNVYNFEKIIKNKHIIERDVPYLITKYLKNNHDFILNLDEALKDTYLKHIKNELAKSSQEIQDKVEKMFKVARMELKPKINDFIHEFIDCLQIIFPIWISKPELISYYTPNQKHIFDVGIFDEASQMFLEKAYPMIWRCKQLIVSGDDKQLKPERIQFNELELDPNYRPLVKEIEFDYSESLLDRAKVSYWNTYSLKNHYRSQAKELIEFSNNHFYDNKLLFTTLNKIDEIPLEINTEIKFKEKNGINKDEAKAILAKLKKEINNFSKTLIICFTTQQKNHLIELIEKEANSDLLEKIKKQYLVIGDLESVQGDEGDLVIISCVYSQESQDYGLLSKPRSENYLNVAITRAKKKMIIFKSLNKQNMKILKNDNVAKNLDIFEKWISYLDNKAKELKTRNENKILNNENISTFKKDIYNSLKQDSRFKNIHINQNLAIGSINIDLAFYEKSINNINLLVILDDWKKNITIQNWFEDIDQEEYLKSRNYNVLRIREQDWLKNKNFIIDKIFNSLNVDKVKNK